MLNRPQHAINFGHQPRLQAAAEEAVAADEAPAEEEEPAAEETDAELAAEVRCYAWLGLDTLLTSVAHPSRVV